MVEAALTEIGATAAVAEHAVRSGDEPLFLLEVRVKLPQALAALVGAIDALTRALARRLAPAAAGFAC